MKRNGLTPSMRITGFIAILLSALATTTTFADLKPNFIKIVNGIAKNVIKEDGTPGMSIAVAKGSEIIHTKGFGQVDITNKTKASPDHIYRIGSVTKQFTSSAIMQLVEQGKLSLDDPLTKFVPEFKGAGDAVTITHLLNHTSGIRSYTNLTSYMRSSGEPMTHEELIGEISKIEFDFKPGEEYRYNNVLSL
tara:strand:- start:33 stop:608 length:576 start_codon:yes stop_codon:yes gene_type:complete